jgi:hypothetical protein
MIDDSQGIAIQPGTPPDKYDIELALVHPETNQVYPVMTLPDVVQVLHERVDPERVFVREYKHLMFGNSLELVGVNIGDGVLKNAGEFSPSFIWSARRDLDENYRATFELEDSTNQTLAKWTDVELVRSLPTSEWRAGDIFKTYYDMPLPAETPHGELRLYVTITDEQNQVLSAGESAAAGKTFVFKIINP